MKREAVSVVRIYLRESEHLLRPIEKLLREEGKVAGLTVLRAVEGFTGQGEKRSTFLVDLSLDLPLVVEFFDSPDRVDQLLALLTERFNLPHIITWQADRVSAAVNPVS
jgi:PII-like signaling protein